MILIYKATIPGSKVFLREYEVKSETTLFGLHNFIQNSLGFAPDQMIMFLAYDAKGDLKHRYGLFDLGGGSVDKVSLNKTLERKEVQLRYVYSMKGGNYILLDYVGEGEYSPKNSYPRQTAEKGINPDQFSKTYNDPDELTPDHGDISIEVDNEQLMEESGPEAGDE
ncbi:MAG: plasmid pRiA4b ORF-3 family protein [Bacteroidales bacterium]|jgi:hypothetical protein|nr:plasmid pRiA4b ORF-3 family protein [Bacteroidales bacterium]MCI2122006.1 plasmid pRiA4b ORF-3 family protein [Bacteroidales bacterium]MCI2145190.1 plasmid pRiA4b ORF-3 family protein [Bacteroidales bacterium]